LNQVSVPLNTVATGLIRRQTAAISAGQCIGRWGKRGNRRVAQYRIETSQKRLAGLLDSHKSWVVVVERQPGATCFFQSGVTVELGYSCLNGELPAQVTGSRK
jgi:hypothetical protein